MIDLPPLLRCCAVAYPRARNTQQTAPIHPIHATPRATTAQQPDLKALAAAVISVANAQQPRNNRATTSQQPRNNPRNNPAASDLQTRARLERIAHKNGLPAELVHGLADADVSACEPFADPVLLAYLRARFERYALSVLQWRALAALRDEPGAARAMVGSDEPDGTYRLAIALRKPDGRHIVGTLALAEPPPLPALLEALP